MKSQLHLFYFLFLFLRLHTKYIVINLSMKNTRVFLGLEKLILGKFMAHQNKEIKSQQKNNIKNVSSD